MKRPFLLLTALALLLLAAALAPLFKSDPGLVQINFLGWTIETSVLVLVLALLLLWFTVSFVVRLWRLPAETARRVRDRRALDQLEKGLLALTEGDWRTAEKALEKSASGHGRSTAQYLAAAQAADGQEAPERREYYLEQADSGGGKRRFLVELTRARLLLNAGHRAEALPILEALHQRRRRHTQVLELLARCYRELRQWEELQALLPSLRKAGVLDEDEVADLQLEMARQRLSEAQDAEDLQSRWKALPRSLRQAARSVEAFAERATALGAAERAEPVLRSQLKSAWSSSLALLYGDPSAPDIAARLKHAEKWLKDHPDDAALHLAMGRLCAASELWGKARHHMIRSLELEPSSGAFDSLGQLLERQGELELAMACFRNALRLEQGKPALPLPGGQERLAVAEAKE